MTEPQATSPLPVGELIARKYRVERVLGADGMGIVVAAHHVDLDERVAIKVLLPEAVANDDWLDRRRNRSRWARCRSWVRAQRELEGRRRCCLLLGQRQHSVQSAGRRAD